jgi:hypothetical protein
VALGVLNSLHTLEHEKALFSSSRYIYDIYGLMPFYIVAIWTNFRPDNLKKRDKKSSLAGNKIGGRKAIKFVKK